jgi:hypothetical protein
LGFQLTEVIESSRPIDQPGIGNGVGRSREEIGQTHLVPHVRRHHGEGRIEQAGHALEEIAQKGPFRTMGTRDATYLVRRDCRRPSQPNASADFQLAFHAFVPMTRQRPEPLIAINGEGAGLHRSKF